MIGRFLRTAFHLSPIQIAARAPHAVVARALRDVTTAMAPPLAGAWPPAFGALRTLATAERGRGAGRLARLPRGSRLHAYEACYGLELGADEDVPRADWSTRVAIEPFPAAVRARRIAVAARCGRRDLGPELARAARAILLQPELHLLGNHLLEDGFALACAGAAARGAEADLWWHAGKAILDWQLAPQFLADGGHVERSASYHVALTAALLETIDLAGASGRGAPALWRDVAGRAVVWLAAVRAPDGSFPLFNDAAIDAAPALDDVLALAAAHGITADAAFAEPRSDDVRLGETGWLTMTAPGAQVVVDAGPDASGWQPGHAHADGLTFELWIDGLRAITDFGVSSYEAGPGRSETRATRSHNTVEVGGTDSCEVWGAFRLGRRGRGRVVGRDRRGEIDRAELAHDGYAWMRGAPTHRRSVALRAGRLDVVDQIVLDGGADARMPWTSRLRLDAAAAERIDVRGSGAVRRREDVWYPLHGSARGALVYEQDGPSPGVAPMRAATWRIEW